ncbi:MAG: hypothetical protein FJY95_04720 [Candidatus Handelsmanbacteria bacterium]|nr:hypothetical protein [Candidatus Handelsmanbacteria bacterium]
MADDEQFVDQVEAVAEADGRYHKAAYLFLYEALRHTVERTAKAEVPRDQKHVSGRDLLRGISEYGLEQFGPLTRSVFAHWGIHQTSDFGHMVFNLVEARLMSKSPQDCIEDFLGGYDFAEEFAWKKRKAQFRRQPAN